MTKLVRVLLAPTLLVGTSACTEPVAVDANRPAASRSTAVGVTQAKAGRGTLSEPAAYDGRVCELLLPGSSSRTAEFYAIWNVGHGILDEPFDTERPDIFAILPGTMHTDPAYPEFDHDHVVSHAPGVPGYNGTWDVWLVVPGPSFDPATYTAPRSVESMMRLIEDGVLAGPLSFSQAGFGPDLVLRAPFVCKGRE